MEKRKANTDVTYCTNKKCKFKNICERNIEHYDFNSKLLYWFGEFNELECEKRRVSDEEMLQRIKNDKNYEVLEILTKESYMANCYKVGGEDG